MGTPRLAHPCTPHCNELMWGPSCSSLPVLWQRVSCQELSRAVSNMQSAWAVRSSASSFPAPAAWGDFGACKQVCEPEMGTCNKLSVSWVCACWGLLAPSKVQREAALPLRQTCSLYSKIYTFNLQWQSLPEILQCKHCATEEAVLKALTLLELGHTRRM